MPVHSNIFQWNYKVYLLLVEWKDEKEDFTSLQPEAEYNESEWKPEISEEQKENSGYEIKSAIYQEDDKLVFQYPQISGLDDKEKERQSMS